MRLTAIVVSVALALASTSSAADAVKSVDEAIRQVAKPKRSESWDPRDLQVDDRLSWLLDGLNYKYESRHAASWEACLRDGKKSLYARLCAAYFLLDEQEEARKFVEEQLASKNLRHRYNAAKTVELHVRRDSTKTWGLNLLIGLVADGSLDGSGVHSSPPGEFPEGDRNDIMFTPIDDICRDLGFMKEKKAVPALISVLERRPRTDRAAFALGEIGDQRAVPALMKILKDTPGFGHSEVTALGKLKAQAAVPVLVSQLGRPKIRAPDPFASSDIDISETRILLEALLEIGDLDAIPAIEKFLKGDFPKEAKAPARRVLAQLNSADPAKSLLELLESETYEPERSDLIRSLTKFRDSRVVGELTTIARSSDSAFMRREAIFGLRDIGDRQSLLALAALLDLTIPRDLKARWGWRTLPDFQRYFPETVEMCLKQRTRQDFGKDRGKWETWINENVE